MLASLFLLLAEEGQQAQPQQPPIWYFLLPIALIMIFMMLRGNRRQERERQAMISNLEKNDKVLTIAEIYGTVISVDAAKNEVVVKVDDNTRMKMTVGAIKRNITKEEAAAAPKADAGTSTAVTAKPNS